MLTQASLPLEVEMCEEGAPRPDCPHWLAGRVLAPRPRVISASKRTDIPAFYLRWMIDRVEAGWVDVPNPMFRRARDPLKRFSHVSLRPEHVLAVVWWSKNYAVYERFHEAFVRYPVQYFHFTINPRRKDLTWIEPDVPAIDETLRQVRFLAGLPAGPAMVAWRYDPLLFWYEDGAARSSWDVSFFEQMCRDLTALGVTRCFTSVADRYGKFERRMKHFFPDIRLRDPDHEEVTACVDSMVEIARTYGMHVFSCAEAALAEREGITRGACIDGRLLRGPTTAATDQKMRGREDCACTIHTDIGDYVDQECGYACVYCYANPNHRRFGTDHSGQKPPAGHTSG